MQHLEFYAVLSRGRRTGFRAAICNNDTNAVLESHRELRELTLPVIVGSIPNCTRRRAWEVMMIRGSAGWLAVLVLCGWGSWGAAQTLQKVVLSNGQTIELREVQSGEVRWYKTLDDFAVVRTPDRYEYAFQGEDGGLVPSGVLVGSLKSKLPFASGIRPTAEFVQKQRAVSKLPQSPPNPNPIEVKQANGVTLRVTLKGGPAYNWYEDSEGYTIVSVRGRFEYALLNGSGALVPCGLEVGSVTPTEAGIKPGLQPGK